MRPEWYRLDERGEPVLIGTLDDYMAYVEANGGEGCVWRHPLRVVAKTKVGDAEVSTVFLPIDHGGLTYSQKPILWETMVFGGKLHQDQDRCSGSREQAEAMHRAMVIRVEEAEGLAAGSREGFRP